MTKHDCTPCKGIRAITPAPVFNRAGLEQLRYRVGTHAEFFETMIAALSARSDAGIASPLTGVSSPLSRLTTRDKDDPTLALLDAWALVADVLTFYQELAANESFLRTAQRPESLRELALLVGHKPRPGLSSSVLLSFEVDDKSAEVLIPAGTPAKSTPVPGSGHNAETFETSQALLARPEWNKIRPRLSRPQQLRTEIDLDRLYLRGIGLRLEKNDLLVIGNADAREGKIMKVHDVEERRDSPIGPISIAYLDVNRLSPSKLIEDVDKAVEGFINVVIDSGLFTSQFLQGLRRELTDPIVGTSLGAVDGELVTKRFTKLRESAKSKFEAIRTNLEEHAKRFSNENLVYTTALKTYIDAHSLLAPGDSAVTRIAEWLSKLTVASSDLETAAQLRQAIFDLSRVTQPIFHVITRSNGQITTMSPQNVVFTECLAKEANFPATPPVVTDLRLIAKFTHGLTVTSADVSVMQPVTSTTLKQAVETLLQQATLATTGATNPPQDRYMKFDIVAVDAATTNEMRLSNGVVRIQTAAAPGEVFKDFKHDKLTISPVRQPEFIDPGFILTEASGDLTQQYQLDLVVEPNLRVMIDGVPFDRTTHGNGTALDLQRRIQRLRVIRPVQNKEPVIVTLKFSSGPVEIAFAQRTLLPPVQAGAVVHVPTECAKILSAFHNGTAIDLSTLVSELTDFRIECAAITNVDLASAAIAQSHTAVSNAQMRKDLGLKDGALITALQAIPRDLNLLSKLDDIAETIYHHTLSTKLQTTPIPSITIADVKIFEDTIAPISAEILSLVSEVSSLDSKRVNSAQQVLGELYSRRDEFVDQLSSMKDIYNGLFEASTDVRQTIVALFGELQKRLTDLQDYLAKSDFSNEEPSNSTVQELVELVSQGDGAIKGIDELAAQASPLTVSQKLAVTQLVSKLEDKIKSVSKEPVTQSQPSQPPVGSIGDILRQLAGLNGAAARDATFELLQSSSSLWAQVSAALQPDRAKQINDAIRTYINTDPKPKPEVWVLRSKANVFGWNSPGKSKSIENPAGTITFERLPATLSTEDLDSGPDDEAKDRIFLDGKFQRTVVDAPIAIQRTPDADPVPYWVKETALMPRSKYELSGDNTRLTLYEASGWWSPVVGSGTEGFGTIRNTKIWCDAEQLELAEELLSDTEKDFSVATDNEHTIVLDRFFPYLSAGMDIVFSGIESPPVFDPEITPPKLDDPNVLVSSELAEIVGVRHDIDKTLYGDVFRTHITLSGPLARRYWRDTVHIAANVVPATHGETVKETLGGGDARKAFQKFPLRRGPLTRLPEPDGDGKKDQLEVRANSVRWKGADDLLGQGARDEAYEVRSLRDGSEYVQFGDGHNGSRLPTGLGNVRAVYRVGLGRAGNVADGRIDQLPQPPLGVRSVLNPLAAEGGADADSVEQSRLRIPRSPASVGGLISARDYEDFALLFAGIDKAKVSVKHGSLVLTVAGFEPAPLRTDGLLLKNLSSALRRLGDQNAAVTVQAHTGLLLYLKVGLRIDPRADWDEVQQAVRDKLLSRFGYVQAKLGQVIYAAEVVSEIQRTPHVQSVTLLEFESYSADRATKIAVPDPTIPFPTPIPKAVVNANDDQLCYLAADVENTVILEPIA